MTTTPAMTRVRLSVPIVWAVAMLTARVLDPWIPIAVAALGLASAVLAYDRLLMGQLFRASRRNLVLGFAAATIMVAATYLLFPWFAREVPWIGVRTENLYATFLTGRPLASVLLFVIPVVLAEEIFWRGAFQEWVVTRIPSRPLLVILVTSLGYALAHAPLGSGLLVVVALACGLFWAALRSLSGSLLPSLVAHLVWDLALIVIPLHR